MEMSRLTELLRFRGGILSPIEPAKQQVISEV